MTQPTSSKEHARDYNRNSLLLRQYGITSAQWLALYNSQLGLCAWCNKPLPTDPRKVHTDHRKGSRLVRGLTHPRCNSGYIQSIEYLLSGHGPSLSDAIHYLSDPPAQRVLAAIYAGTYVWDDTREDSDRDYRPEITSVPDALQDTGMQQAQERLLTTGEAAVLCGVSRSTLRRFVAQGQLRAWRTPGKHLRFARDECMVLWQPAAIPVKRIKPRRSRTKSRRIEPAKPCRYGHTERGAVSYKHPIGRCLPCSREDQRARAKPGHMRAKDAA